MKNSWFTFGIAVICCVLAFQFGCKQEAEKLVAQPAVSQVGSVEQVTAQPAVPQTASPPPAATLSPAAVPAEVNAIADTNALQPSIKMEMTLYDFGEVGIRSVNTCHFKFANIGKGLLVIKNIKSTCGCAVPELPKKEYAPGQSGSLEVRYSAPAEEGDIIRHLYVQSNDKQNPEVELVLKAKIVAKVKYEPENLKLSFKEQNAGCPPIKLKSTDGQPFAITSFKSTADCITVDFNPNAKAAEFTLQPKVDIEKLRKTLNGGISIGLTHPQCDQVNLFFEALPAFKINPPTIMILKAQPQSCITREVWVLNNYNEPFEIESVLSQKGMIKLKSQERHDNGYKLVLEITPPVFGGTVKKIRLFSDTAYVKIKGGETLEISCRGFFEKDSGTAK